MFWATSSYSAGSACRGYSLVPGVFIGSWGIHWFLGYSLVPGEFPGNSRVVCISQSQVRCNDGCCFLGGKPKLGVKCILTT